MPTPHEPPSAVRRTLKKLGADIKDARRVRRLTAEIVAARAFTSRKTLHRIEAGEHGVSMGIYAAVLAALGLLDRLGEVADPAGDDLGRRLSSAALPQRVRLRKTS